MRTHGGAYDIERVLRMAAPVADGGGAGVGERHVARSDGMHRGSEHLHALHVDMLALHIRLAHEDFTLHAHQGAHRGCGYAMLSGSRFCYDAPLAHLPCQQNLSYGVVYLVRTGVVEVFALEIEPAAVLLAHPACKIQGRGSAHIVAQQSMILGAELLAVYYGAVALSELLHAAVEDFRNIGTSEVAVVAVDGGRYEIIFPACRFLAFVVFHNHDVFLRG